MPSTRYLRFCDVENEDGEEWGGEFQRERERIEENE